MTNSSKHNLIAPLRREAFRRLWAGMSFSYAGDRLQELAQGWIVASLTGSAMAVSGISILASIPQLFMPLGGVIADQVNRHKLLLIGQLGGALLTMFMAILALLGRIAVWHIYIWAFLAGVIWLVVRPSYKVVVTEAVPSDEVRQAVSLNSMTETTALVVMNGGGGALLQSAGLPVAFFINSISYAFATGCLWSLRDLGRLPEGSKVGLSVQRVFGDLKAGLVYLARQPRLHQPLFLTLVSVMSVWPLFSLLPVIVKNQGGSIATLGYLGAVSSLGSFLGAVFAGTFKDGDRPVRVYAGFGLLTALGLAAFTFLPGMFIRVLTLGLFGFLLFAEAVWNTSRVRLAGDPIYQARLQSLTTMSFTLGGALGALWGGIALDHFGLPALLIGAVTLGLCSVMLFFGSRNRG